MPLRDGDDAMTVNWLEMEIADATGKVTYRNSIVTDLPVFADTVAELVAAGRARWVRRSARRMEVRDELTNCVKAA